MKITVTKDNVKIEEFDIVHEGEHRVNKCSFSFSEEYTEELVKKAIFTSQNSSVEVAIINNECDIPTEILRARNIVLLGVYAYKVVDDKLDLRYSPSPDAFKVNSGSYIERANESEEITSSQFEQYMQALNDGLNKVEESIKKMDEATSSATQLVDKIEQKLENGEFIGPEGSQGIQGVPGTNGKDGVGITTITSGQSTVEEDKTITPITVNKTDGSSQVFNVEAKNGLDGQNGQDGKDGVNGQDGLTPTIGDNGNWFLGDTDTGKPSRGEVGPSPDLTDYVKNTDYATATKAGIIKATNYLNVTSDGVAYASPITQEIYESTNPNVFIAKGTLENIKDDYVGSSTPVQDLTSTVTNIQEEQDESKPKNTVSGEMITVDDALAYKMFEFKADGSSEQETTTGKNKLDYTYLSLNEEQSTLNGGSYTYENGLLEIDATKATNNMTIRSSNISNSEFVLKAGTYYAHVCINTKKVSDGTFTQYMAGQITLAEDVYINQWFVPCPKGTKENTILMIEPGNEKTEWEPYTGGQPSPSPDYEQPINSIEGSVKFDCSGKNIFTKKSSTQTSNGITTVFKDNTFTYNGIASLNYSNCVPTGNFKITKGTYTFSITNPLDTSFNVRFQKTMNYNDGSFEARINKGETSVTFTLPDDFDFFYFYLLTKEGNTYSGHASIQMEKGTTATEYEPYIEPNEVTFNLNDEKLRSVGDVKDELVVDLSTGDYYKVENVGEVVFDGSDDETLIKRSDITTPNTSCFRVENFDYTLIRDLIGMCNYFRYDTEKQNIKDTFRFIKSPGYAIQFCIEDNFASNSDEFRTWLSTHNTIVDYILQTPTTKKLGTLSSEDLAKLKTFKGYNNVTINTNLGLMNIRFTYGLDIKKYIDNKLAEISSAMIEEG